MKKQTGFTIVELLVVIVVIGILAVITIVAYGTIQDRARAAAVTSGIKSVEDGFKLLAAEQQQATWWYDHDFTGVNNPELSTIIAASNLKKYLPTVPTIPGSTPTWTYDNDLDTRDPAACDTSWTGVVLAIQGIPASVSSNVDATMDDGNATCGRVRISGTTLIYNLSFTQTMQ